MQTCQVVNQYQTDTPQFTLHDTEAPNFEARLAIALVEKWGMVSGVEGGEDSSGRAKLRLMTPGEVVERAVATSELLAKTIREKNWMTIIPSFEEGKQIAKDQRKKNEEDEAADRLRRAADRADKAPK